MYLIKVFKGLNTYFYQAKINGPLKKVLQKYLCPEIRI